MSNSNAVLRVIDEREMAIERVEAMVNQRFTVNPSDPDVSGWHLPNAAAMQATVTGIQNTIASVATQLIHLASTSGLEMIPDVAMLASVIDGFAASAHRQLNRQRGLLARAMSAEADLIRAADGTEFHDTELQKATAERLLREHDEALLETVMAGCTAAYESLTNRTWLPPQGNRNTVHTKTAAVMVAQSFSRARSQLEQASLTIPTGTRVAITGGFVDKKTTVEPAAVEAKLRKLKDITADLVLILTDEPGPNQVAAQWARASSVPFTVIKAPWTDKRKQSRDGKPVNPLKLRNEAVLAAEPRVVLAWPGNGMREHLVGLCKQHNAGKEPAERIKILAPTE